MSGVVSGFQRRRDGRRFYEPTAAEDRYYSECDRALDLHDAAVDADEALLEHLSAWREGEGQLKVGMHSAACLRKGHDDCVCVGGEVTVFVQDPADQVDAGRASVDPWWSGVAR